MKIPRWRLYCCLRLASARKALGCKKSYTLTHQNSTSSLSSNEISTREVYLLGLARLAHTHRRIDNCIKGRVAKWASDHDPWVTAPTVQPLSPCYFHHDQCRSYPIESYYARMLHSRAQRSVRNEHQRLPGCSLSPRPYSWLHDPSDL